MPVRGVIMPIDDGNRFTVMHEWPTPRIEMPGHYKLVGRTPVKVPTLMDWAMTFSDPQNKIANDQVGDASVSTVFLGIDHNFFGDGPPVLFETMVFVGKGDGQMKRYASYDDAERGHKETLAEVRRSQFGVIRNDNS